MKCDCNARRMKPEALIKLGTENARALAPYDLPAGGGATMATRSGLISEVCRSKR